MARRPGRPKKGELVDMGIYPSDDCYEPPPDEDCESWPESIELALGHRLTIRRVFRKGQSTVVYFSVNQALRVDGRWMDIARIDCSHGKVHRHQFTRTGGNHIKDLEIIPADHGEEVVDRWCDPATDMMQTDWQDNLARWQDDR